VPRAADLYLGAARGTEAVGEGPEKEADEQAVLLAYARQYDGRGGGVEIDIKESKQGWG
jgi:hypothetical protein